MSYWEAIILGIVQGATEFLPISSDGHLKLVQRGLGFEKGNLVFDVALHAGTFLTVLIAFRKDILFAMRDRRIIINLIIATLPLIPLGLFGKKLIEETLDTVPATGVGLLITSAMLFATSAVDRGTRPLSQVRKRDALLVGVLQTLAPAPGISRSGSTIFGGLLSGLSRDAAARFSFLISVPAVGGALLLHAKDLWENPDGRIAVGPTIAGVIVAFIVGLIAVHVLLYLVVKGRLRGFAIYCLALGLIVLSLPLFSSTSTEAAPATEAVRTGEEASSASQSALATGASEEAPTERDPGNR